MRRVSEGNKVNKLLARDRNKNKRETKYIEISATKLKSKTFSDYDHYVDCVSYHRIRTCERETFV